jgi:glutamate carboxypeptidase
MFQKLLRLAVPLALVATVAFPAQAQTDKIKTLAAQHKQPLLDTLKELVSIETGSRDVEGIDKLQALVAERLKALGGDVETIEPSSIYKMEDTPAPSAKWCARPSKAAAARRSC